jgi:8-oxo-dGTP diphosphatase
MPKASFVQLWVDVVLFTIIHQELHVLLVKRGTAPYQGVYSLPGGLLALEETVEQAVNKVLYRETHVLCEHVKLFWTFSALHRDPRWRVVSISYYSIIRHDDLLLKKWSTQLAVEFFPFKKIGELAFDHNAILAAAYLQLQDDLSWSDIIKYFMPKRFSLAQLQDYCESIYNRHFEKRNFAKYVKTHFKIQKTIFKQEYVPHRPAILYRFI